MNIEGRNDRGGNWMIFAVAPLLCLGFSNNSYGVAACDGNSIPATVVASVGAIAESGGATGQFIFAIPEVLGGDTQLTLLISGTAANGVDYVSLPNTITIPAGLSVAALTVTPVPDMETEGTETLTVTITSSNNLCVYIGSPSFAAIAIADGDSHDLNNDGKGDLLWWNSLTGASAAWLMNGPASTSSAFLAAPGDWVPIIENDLDGDGVTDIVWRNSATSSTAVWLMKSLTPKASGFLLGPSTWTPLLAAGFDGTASRGILWRDGPTGAVAIWLMNNGVVPAYTQIIYPGGAWIPLTAGNFDGDSNADILWRHPDGSVAIWLMQGNASLGLSAKASAVILGPGTNWVPTFVTDLDGDGRSDIVWGNTVSGDTAVWLMNGLAPKPGGTAVILPGAAGWSVTHVLDLDGDAKSDLIWRNQVTGATAAWLMDGLASKPGGTAVLFTDPNWEVTHHFDFNNDLKGDLVWHNNVTGQTAVWLMNGLSPSSASIILSDPNWSILPPEVD